MLAAMKTVQATFESGVFKPLAPVILPEHCTVEFEPRLIENRAGEAGDELIYSILRERHQSGATDTAARHNEHQP